MHVRIATLHDLVNNSMAQALTPGTSATVFWEGKDVNLNTLHFEIASSAAVAKCLWTRLRRQCRLPWLR